MKKSLILIVLILLPLLFSPPAQASVNSSTESTALNRSAFNYLISTLWNSQVGAFKASPTTEPYNFWTDDQAKVLSLLDQDVSGTYTNQTANQWADAIRNYLSSVTMTNTGYVLRRQLNPLTPTLINSDPHNVMAGNNIFNFQGDLTLSRNFTNRIIYEPQGQTVAYLQGHILNYNSTDKDLSYAQQPTGTLIASGPGYVQLRQIWAYPDFTLNIDYFLQSNKPYLLVKYTITANKLLTGPPKFAVPLDQLDFLGTTTSTNGPHIGYAWFWAPGFPDQRASDVPQPQHLLGDVGHPESSWNQTWYMIHIHDKIDGTANSFAIIADWGTNKTGLVAVDSVLTGSTLPKPRLANTYHYLKQYYQLAANLSPTQSASFEVKYYFLASHDWLNLAPVYQELMARNLNNLDLSSTYQYGAIVYALAKLYQQRSVLNDYNLAKKIENYWFSNFNKTGPLPNRNGTYMQSLPFMIRADVLLAQIGLAGDIATFSVHATALTNELLNTQNQNVPDANYGMFRERRYYNATSGIQYWGNSYLDFQAPGISALAEYLAWKGANSTVTTRLNLVTNKLFLTTAGASYGIVVYDPVTQLEKLQSVIPGRIACFLNATNTVIDADLPTYKNALLLDAFSHPQSIGYANSTFTLRELSFLWQNSALSPNVIAYVDSTRAEYNTETEPWAVVAWRTWTDQMLSATGSYVALIYLQPFNAYTRLMNITWNPTTSSLYQLKFAVNSTADISSVLLADRSPTGVRGIFQTGSLSGSWAWTNSNQTISATMKASAYPSQITFHITWLGTTGTLTTLGNNYYKISWIGTANTQYNFTGLHPTLPGTSKVFVVNSTGSFNVTGSDSTYFRLLDTPNLTGNQTVYLLYNANAGWVYSSAPMPGGYIQSQSLYGSFTVSPSANVTVKIDTNSYGYGPRQIQLQNATNPYGNGSMAGKIYSLTVHTLPGVSSMAIYVTFETSGSGTAILVVVAISGAVAAGVIYVARRRIQG